MSSKSNVKQTKRDRPRSTDRLRRGGKRDGTPEKSTTPNASQDALQEEGRPQSSKNVIMNEEIQALQIKPEDLLKVREGKEPKPPSERRRTPAPATVVVRKLKPASEWDKPAPKMVTVARPAPPDAPLKPIDFSGDIDIGGAGPRIDHVGNIVAHSILGSVEDFKHQALEAGDLPAELAETRDGERQPKKPTLKYEKKKVEHPKQESVEDSNALKNWQKRMLERKRQQGYISKLLQKPPETLVMNQADNYRKTQEQRYLIDRTIPTMDYGKGYRIGSEFWKQQERIGNDLAGVHMTLSQTERGYPSPIQHVGVPKTILEEKGTYWEKPRSPFHKPWHKTPFLQDRSNQLQEVMKELDPHQPDMLNLEIVGNSKYWDEVPAEDGYGEFIRAAVEEDEEMSDDENMDPLKDHPDVHPAPIFGPSIQFAGQAARWTGDNYSFQGQVGIEARVTFEAFSGQRKTSFLEIVNDGTTSIYYDWKKMAKSNPFDMVTAKVQRFYFNTSSGVILPGDTMKFPFVFKSPNAGVFTEQWQLETRPVVCGGAALVVTLRGVALQEDKYKRQRTELEQELAQKQAEQVVRQVLSDILEGIRTPERPKSPIDAYITEEEVFSRKNPGMHFSNEMVRELGDLYQRICPEEEREGRVWDLSLQTMKEEIMAVDEDEERKQEWLEAMNRAVVSLSFPPFTPTQQIMYNVGYQLMLETVDSVVGQSILIRNVLGMPDKDADDIPDSDTTHSYSRPNSVAVDDESASLGDSRKGGKDKGKPDPKDKKAAKDAKPPKTADKGKEPSKGKSTPKRPSTRDKDRVTTPTSNPQTPEPSVDPILDSKYRDKMYTQIYSQVTEMVDRMAVVFEDIKQNDGSPAIPQLF